MKRDCRPRDRARYFRYGRFVVRVYRGAAKVTGLVEFRLPSGRVSRANRSFAPLPKRYRKEIREQTVAKHAPKALEIPKGAWT